MKKNTDINTSININISASTNKYKYIHVLIFFMLFGVTNSLCLYSQTNADTSVTVSIENFLYNERENYAEFDIYLTRNDDDWQYWENATFQLFLYDIFGNQIKYRDFIPSVVYGSSEIMLAAGTSVYQIDTKMMDDRLMMIITHRDTSYMDLPLFHKNSKLRLYKLKITRDESSTAPFPTSVLWASPADYYQAIAYKYVKDVDKYPDYFVEVNDADNIELEDARGIKKINFTINNTRPPEMLLDYFIAKYVGNLNVVLEYATLSEYKNNGFIIKRGYAPNITSDYESISDEYFTELVADYRDPEFNNRMKGLYTDRSGKVYDAIADKIEYRAFSYLYRLYYQKDENDTIIALSTIDLNTPNFLLVKAEANPNPFRGRTTLRYVLEDDVYMTCEVFDALGKKVKNLVDVENGVLDRTFVKLGEHFADFEAPELATQGLYEVVFTAYPVNDPYLEIARASVKVQYIRD